MAIDYTKRPGSTPGGRPEDSRPGVPPAGNFPPPDPAAAAGFSPPAPPAGVNLSKVTLTKGAPAVSLSKGAQGGGLMKVNLNWSARQPGAKKGFFARLVAQDDTDLDLGCLYERMDGTKGVIQALGNSFGSLDGEPYVFLDGDDRSGAVSGGENMMINFSAGGGFRRVLIFAMIYSGAANWAAADGVVTLYPAVGPEIEVRLDASDSQARICAIALLQDRGGDLEVRREVSYINGNQAALDRQYGWGLDWTPGRK